MPLKGLIVAMAIRLLIYLLIYTELLATVFQESYNLLGSGNTGIDIGFGSLRTHLFGVEK